MWCPKCWTSPTFTSRAALFHMMVILIITIIIIKNIMSVIILNPNHRNQHHIRWGTSPRKPVRAAPLVDHISHRDSSLRAFPKSHQSRGSPPTIYISYNFTNQRETICEFASYHQRPSSLLLNPNATICACWVYYDLDTISLKYHYNTITEPLSDTISILVAITSTMIVIHQVLEMNGGNFTFGNSSMWFAYRKPFFRHLVNIVDVFVIFWLFSWFTSPRFAANSKPFSSICHESNVKVAHPNPKPPSTNSAVFLKKRVNVCRDKIRRYMAIS